MSSPANASPPCALLTRSVSRARTATSEPLALTPSVEWMPISPDDTKSKSCVCTDNVSDAVNDTSPLDKLALSDANARSDPPKLMSTSADDTDTDPDEYMLRRDPAFTAIEPDDTSARPNVSNDADVPAMPDTCKPDSSDTAPALDTPTDALDTDTAPPLTTDASSAVTTDTVLDDTSIDDCPTTDTLSPDTTTESDDKSTLKSAATDNTSEPTTINVNIFPIICVAFTCANW